MTSVSIQGHIHILVDFVHSYATNPASSSTFGAFNGSDVMRFGSAGITVDISSASNEPTYLQAKNNGKLEFYHVTFAGNEMGAPNWYANSGDILVDDAPGNTYFVEVPFDIHAENGAELCFEHDFSCAGKLTLDATSGVVIVTAVDGVTVDVYTP